MAIGVPQRARKSELLWGEVASVPVVAKRLVKSNPVWEWYLERELAMYRAFAAHPPGVRVPRLVAGERDLIVIERLIGEPLATKRRPFAALPIRTIAALIAMHDQLAAWPGTPPAVAPSPRVRAQLRERLLEDPTDSMWIREGLQRCGRRGILEEKLARQLDDAVAAHSPVAFGHGDLLLRNVVCDEDDDLGFVDWECAGSYVRDWDLALLWTQLAPAARTIVEDAVRGNGMRWRAFLGLVVFALAREIRFRQAFDQHAEVADLRAEIDEVVARIIRA